MSVQVQFSHSVVSNSLRPHGLQHARLPCPSPTPGACSNSCPSSQWCLSTISSSVVPFSSCLQSFPAWGSYSNESVLHIKWPKYWNSVSASVLTINIKDQFPLGLTDLIFRKHGHALATLNMKLWHALPSWKLKSIFDNLVPEKSICS